MIQGNNLPNNQIWLFIAPLCQTIKPYHWLYKEITCQNIDNDNNDKKINNNGNNNNDENNNNDNNNYKKKIFFVCVFFVSGYYAHNHEV